MTRADRDWSGLRTALAMFTVLPLADAGEAGGAELGDGDAARAVLWLPAVGVLLGAIGAAVVLVVGEVNASGPGRLLGAVLAVAVSTGLTGALHLDGLADTADGLGSRRPPAAALEIMRRSDIGPMGVAALVFALLIQVAAIAAVPRVALAAGALALAEVTGRVSVVLATASPAARPGGFGALVAGQTTRRARVASVLGLALLVGGGSMVFGRAVAGAGLAAAAAGLGAGTLLQRAAERRFGGMTGDIFGAILLVSLTTTVLAAALLW